MVYRSCIPLNLVMVSGYFETKRYWNILNAISWKMLHWSKVSKLQNWPLIFITFWLALVPTKLLFFTFSGTATKQTRFVTTQRKTRGNQSHHEDLQPNLVMNYVIHLSSVVTPSPPCVPQRTPRDFNPLTAVISPISSHFTPEFAAKFIWYKPTLTSLNSI